MPEDTVSEERKRSTCSFVLHQGHTTTTQQHAIDTMQSRFGMDFQEAPSGLNRTFGRDNPEVSEVSLGMDIAAVRVAKRLSGTDFSTTDVHGPGVDSILKLIEEEHISNIRVIRHNAMEAVEKMLENDSLDGIHIFSPDPWHKKHHNRRRLVQMPFAEKLLPKLKDGGCVHMVTGQEECTMQMLEVLSNFDSLQNAVTDYILTPGYHPEARFGVRGKQSSHGV